jgi:hypothetical protein
MKVAVAFICLVLAACTGQSLRPAAEISSRPLDPAVDSATVFNMIALAARDRICAAREQRASEQRESRPTGGSKWTPIPSLEYAYETYSSCMDEPTVAACDATEQDLRTLHTLLDRDPRLAALLSFEGALVRLKQQCPALQQLAAGAKALRPWSPREVWRCEDRYQPVLLTTAVLLRTQQPRAEESRFLWFAGCTGTAGYIFMREHCRTVRRQARPEQGVEAYFCSQIRKQFGS